MYNWIELISSSHALLWNTRFALEPPDPWWCVCWENTRLTARSFFPGNLIHIHTGYCNLCMYYIYLTYIYLYICTYNIYDNIIYIYVCTHPTVVFSVLESPRRRPDVMGFCRRCRRESAMPPRSDRFAGFLWPGALWEPWPFLGDFPIE